MLVQKNTYKNTWRYADEQLTELLEEFAKKLGRVPTAEEVQACPDMPSMITYNRRFGSYAKALRAVKMKSRYKYYANQQLIKLLLGLINQLGRMPTAEEVDACPDMPSSRTYRDRFGSWDKALKAAELRSKRTYTDQQLIESLQELAKELGHAPTYKDIRKCPCMPSDQTYTNRFGSLDRALEIAELKTDTNYWGATDCQLIEFLQQLKKELGRTPSWEDIRDHPGMPSVIVYVGRFGPWPKALEVAGMKD